MATLTVRQLMEELQKLVALHPANADLPVYKAVQESYLISDPFPNIKTYGSLRPVELPKRLSCGPEARTEYIEI